MDLGLKGEQVIITGGSAGIGLACAHAFGTAGASLNLVARNPTTLAAAAAELRKTHGVTVTTFAMDMADSPAVTKMIDRCADAAVLVNNAGAAPPGSIETLDEATWRAAWGVKVFGYINATRAMLRHMYARKRGVIVNVIGGGVLQPLRLCLRHVRQCRARRLHQRGRLAFTRPWRARGGGEIRRRRAPSGCSRSRVSVQRNASATRHAGRRCSPICRSAGSASPTRWRH